MADDQVPWPNPPREPGPWGGGPPVAPPGNTALPPLPGASGTMQTANASTNPWANAATPPTAMPTPPSSPPRRPFPGLPGGPKLVDRAPAWVLAVSALIVLALIGGGAYLVIDGGPKYPSKWDARVAPIADWVERARKLDYKHPVEVQFLTAAAYTKVSTDDGGGDGATAESAQATKDQVAQLRALGFLTGDLDLDKASKTLNDSGSLAFYSPDTKKVYVRGTKMTPGLRVTLAHELTHVLQDQYFDLTRVSSMSDGRASVMRALAEGDATRIEDQYATKVLTKAERAAYEKESNSAGTAAQDKLDKEVPPILTTVFAAPYILGPELIAYLEKDGGEKKIDEALQNPPTEEVLFNPLMNGKDAAKAVDVPLEAPKGTEVIDDGEFGPTTWYLLLASRMQPNRAIKAVDGWGGDHYVVYRENKKVCVSVAAKFDTPADQKEFRADLAVWAAKSVAGTASVTETADTVAFKSCDPGKDAKPVGGGVTTDLLGVPAARTEIYDQVVGPDANADQASCFANAVIDRFTPTQLNDAAYIQSAQGQQLLASLRSTCG
ncbi:MAG: hypothetical protein JWM89_4112 [Acidimicrobiales bacterium]|nr:hypothetical protein [Acidimicrobiales bacterium]